MSDVPSHLNPTVLQLERTIAGLEKQIEKLKEECLLHIATGRGMVTEITGLTKERDQWRKCAERLREEVDDEGRCTTALSKRRESVLDEYDRLTREAKAKGTT